MRLHQLQCERQRLRTETDHRRVMEICLAQIDRSILVLCTQQVVCVEFRTPQQRFIPLKIRLRAQIHAEQTVDRSRGVARLRIAPFRR